MASLVYPRERLYFGASLVVSAAVYTALVLSVAGIAVIALGVAVLILAHGLFIGSLKGSAVRVSPRQFREVHRVVEDLSRRMGLAAAPAVYAVHSGGLLNALARRFLDRNFVVMSSDVLELAGASGDPTLAFVLARELAHLERRHFTMRWLLIPSMLVPFLGTAYARSCEYTCDRIAAHYRPDGAMDGLRVLAADRRLYPEVDVDELQDRADDAEDFWTWLAEMFSCHPFLAKRIAALPDVARAVSVPRALV